MNKYVKIVADRLHKTIQDQLAWIELQNELVDTFIATGQNPNKERWDLRQSIQALATGNSTKDILLQKFETEIGMSYNDYLVSIKSSDKPVKSEVEILAEKLAILLNNVSVK